MLQGVYGEDIYEMLSIQNMVFVCHEDVNSGRRRNAEEILPI